MHTSKGVTVKSWIREFVPQQRQAGAIILCHSIGIVSHKQGTHWQKVELLTLFRNNLCFQQIWYICIITSMYEICASMNVYVYVHIFQHKHLKIQYTVYIYTRLLDYIHIFTVHLYEDCRWGLSQVHPYIWRNTPKVVEYRDIPRLYRSNSSLGVHTKMVSPPTSDRAGTNLGVHVIQKCDVLMPCVTIWCWEIAHAKRWGESS